VADAFEKRQWVCITLEALCACDSHDAVVALLRRGANAYPTVAACTRASEAEQPAAEALEEAATLDDCIAFSSTTQMLSQPALFLQNFRDSDDSPR
jgi:hypothetical protein